MRDRNRAVLLAHGREEAEQQIAREFERIALLVKRDLEGYPALQRRLLDEITRVEEDYKKCGEVPPPPPEWVEAVAAVAKVKSNGNELVVQDPRGNQPLDQGDPRQDARRVPARLRGPPQDPRRLHAVLALAGQDPRPGRPQDDEPRRPRGRHRFADGALRADREEDRPRRACAHGVGADAVLHRHAGARHRRGRRADQLQADRAADVGDGGRGGLPHGFAAHFRSCRAGDHLRRGDHGPVPHGDAEDHAPLPEDPRACRTRCARACCGSPSSCW